MRRVGLEMASKQVHNDPDAQAKADRLKVSAAVGTRGEPEWRGGTGGMEQTRAPCEGERVAES